MFVSNHSQSQLPKHVFARLQIATAKDQTLGLLKNVISLGWPLSKNDVDPQIRHYFPFRDELTIEDGIILRGERFVVPQSLVPEMKAKIHTGHMGINSCLRRARSLLYWPNMSNDIREYVERCNTCSTFQTKQSMQPLVLHDIPDRPWQKVGIDIFTLKSRNYLITVDYYSQFFEVDFLSDMTSTTLISKLKAHFSRYGIPDQLYSDNAPNLVSSQIKNFCLSYGIEHKTSSAGNPRANGQSESAVKIAKSLLKKSMHNRDDPYLALLNYRNTPSENSDYSPAQTLLGRRTKTNIPTNPALLVPQQIDHKKYYQQREDKHAKFSSKHDHKRVLPDLQPQDNVRMQPIDNSEQWKQAKVVQQVPDNSRSYIVEDENGRQYRRDRQHLRLKPPSTPVETSVKTPLIPPNLQTPQTHKEPQQTSEVTPLSTPAPANVNSPVKTRSGRLVNKPVRYGQVT